MFKKLSLALALALAASTTAWGAGGIPSVPKGDICNIMNDPAGGASIACTCWYFGPAPGAGCHYEECCWRDTETGLCVTAKTITTVCNF